MVVFKDDYNLVFFSIAYFPYDIKDIKLVSKPLISPTYLTDIQPLKMSDTVNLVATQGFVTSNCVLI
jgi:hypothetical protein